uniref:ShKT domain-containing protein n=1 Tax=Steinernema glaseri TaxID=37863 RepID=A0A1I7YVT3_9BILA
MSASSVLLVLVASFALCVVASPRSKFSPVPSFPSLETRFPPCCGDSIGSSACKRLRANNPSYFQRRCDSEPDFSLIQCCSSCGLDSAPQRHRVFFAEGTKSNHCFDRHGGAFCERFVTKTGVWSKSAWSCSGENAQLAFRLCRRSCGYCKRDLYAGRDGGEFRPTPCGQVPDYVFPKEN